MTFTVHKDVMVAMRDGVELATDLWVPETTPAPTLLVRLPYSKDLPGLLGYGLVPNLFALVEAGYAVVYQDCRGTFRSAGEFTPMLNEPDDGADTIAWLLEQPWCDGNIGTYGPSYLGFVQWASVTASRPGAGDRALRHHDRLLHHPVVLRRRRLVLALDPVVVHDDGAGRGAAPARPGHRRPAAAGRPGAP